MESWIIVHGYVYDYYCTRFLPAAATTSSLTPAPTTPKSSTPFTPTKPRICSDYRIGGELINTGYTSSSADPPPTPPSMQGQRWNEKNSYTLFVDNLPANATKQWLVKVFNSVGRVVDAFLSVKRRASNPLRFAFVRFATRREATRAIEQLDGWLVWGNRLMVVESKYRRNGTVEMEKERKEKRVSASNVNTGEGEKANGEQRRQRSYKDVLETGRQLWRWWK
ncbi:hypothetical protein PIB30_018575 [Stylosanthes scabra]|uniref:RRM domain-containing protein n=1 Tax=Stylosanthes scabra TaxID=79078 RepID=A0ABU6R885_9FABA|nr:hypothetical protein [Stylosanthes scabra]